jgi:hypothetical protein
MVFEKKEQNSYNVMTIPHPHLETEFKGQHIQLRSKRRGREDVCEPVDCHKNRLQKYILLVAEAKGHWTRFHSNQRFLN